MLLAGLAAVYLYWLVTDQAFASNVDLPGYLMAYFIIQVTGLAVTIVAMVAGRMSGWALGSVLAAATIAVYVASRIWAFPDLAILVGWLDYALGTFTVILAALYLGLHVAVLTKVCVAYPQQRDWHD